MTKYRTILFLILQISSTQVWAQASIAGRYDRANHIFIPIDTNISAEPFINGAAKFIIKREIPQSEDSTFSYQSCGILDTAGKIIIPAKYDYLLLTNDGYFVATFNGRTELRSLADGVIIPNKYDWMYPAQNNRYIVSINHQGSGVISIKGEIVVPIRNQEVIAFGSGYAVLGDYDRTLLDSTGKVIVKTPESGLPEPEPPYWNMGHAGFMVYNQKKDSFICYKDIRDYYSLTDRIIVYERGNKWGLMDTLGGERTAPLYDQVSLYYFRNDSIGYGRNLIGARKGNKWGVINNFGVTKLKFKYDSLYQYQWHGVTIVRKGAKYGFLKKNHHSTTPIKYDEIFGVSINERNPLGIIPVKIAGKWGFVSENAIELTPVKYDTFIFIAPETVKVTIGDKVGLLDNFGKEVYPCVYKSIRYNYTDQKFIVEKF